MARYLHATPEDESVTRNAVMVLPDNQMGEDLHDVLQGVADYVHDLAPEYKVERIGVRTVAPVDATIVIFREVD